jgi:transmembrane sensor
MTTNNNNHPLNPLDRFNPPYSRSEADVWQAMEARMAQTKGRVVTMPVYRRLAFKLAVAATVAVLVGWLSMTLIYTKTIDVPRGSMAQIELPDGSSVHVNAQSMLTYKPYAWRFSREVKLSGEAFFTVKKGKTFEVQTGEVTTSVLGTSFNVYARNTYVEVTCVTGLVKVSAANQWAKVKPGEKVSWQKQITLTQTKLNNVANVSGWTKNEYHYQAAPLSKVVEDICLQYNIDVEWPDSINLAQLTYSGHLKMDISAENALNLIGKPFGLMPEKRADKVYRLTNVQ